MAGNNKPLVRYLAAATNGIIPIRVKMALYMSVGDTERTAVEPALAKETTQPTAVPAQR